MSGTLATIFPFDYVGIAEDMRHRFGWADQDLASAMAQLLPAAMTGFRHFGGLQTAARPSPGPADWLAMSPFFGAGFAPFGSAAPPDTLTFFYGPEPVRNMVADHIATVTGLQKEAIAEMMPVAATLAMGQMARPYLPGPAQDMLDAFMRGFARGRPKPRPGPADYFQGYTDAMTAFWSAFLRPNLGSQDAPPADAEVRTDEAEAADDTSEETPDQPPPEQAPSEFETLISGWMAAGRDLQSSQFKAFDSLFEKAAKDVAKDTPSQDL